MSSVVKRVLMGSSLALVAAATLAANARFDHVAWAAASLLTAGVVYELARMDGHRGRGLAFTLGVPAVGLAFLFLELHAAGPQGWKPAFPLLLAYPTAVLLAAAAFAGERLGRRLVGLRAGWVWAVVPAGIWVASVLAFGPTSLTERNSLWVALAVLAFAPLFLAPRDDKLLGELRFTLVLALWAIAPLFGFVEIDGRGGTRGLIALVVLSKIGDIAAYFVGRAIGKRHPFPSISPNKTVAGFVASFVAATLAGVVVVALDLLPAGELGWTGAALVGLAVNVAAQAGDLFESWVKRRAGVKDSGTWFGPSGGVLDVVDSLLFTTPVLVALWPWLLGD